MSMPQITLEDIDPRLALANIAASIALQEAALSHVLNAEGEKIQAVVGMTGASVADLQSVNLSVGGMVDSVALFEDDLRDKLQTALDALYPPPPSLRVYFVDASTGLPVDCQCAVCTLTSAATGSSETFFAQGDSVLLTGLTPGDYSMQMVDACTGYFLNTATFPIEVDANGEILFNGAVVTAQAPAEVALTSLILPGGAAADATPPSPRAAFCPNSAPAARQAQPEPPEPEPDPPEPEPEPEPPEPEPDPEPEPEPAPEPEPEPSAPSFSTFRYIVHYQYPQEEGGA